MGVVVDRLEGDAPWGPPADEPFGAAVVHLSLGMALYDGLLDIGRIEPTLPKATLGVVSPDEALDFHFAEAYAMHNLQRPLDQPQNRPPESALGAGSRIMEKLACSKNTPGTDAAFDLLSEIAVDPASDERYPDGTVLIPADSPDASVLMSRAIDKRRPIAIVFPDGSDVVPRPLPHLGQSSRS